MKSFIGNFTLIITIIIVNLAEPGAAESSAIDYDDLVYDDKAQSTFIARILKIHELDWGSGKGKTMGVYLTVAVRDKEYLVPVAPAWYLMNKAVLGPDQTINIAGIMLKTTGTAVILPKWIKIGNEYIYIRNYDGTTFWEVSDDYKAYTKSADTKDHNPGRSGHGGHAGH